MNLFVLINTFLAPRFGERCYIPISDEIKTDCNRVEHPSPDGKTRSRHSGQARADFLEVRPASDHSHHLFGLCSRAGVVSHQVIELCAETEVSYSEEACCWSRQLLWGRARFVQTQEARALQRCFQEYKYTRSHTCWCSHRVELHNGP